MTPKTKKLLVKWGCSILTLTAATLAAIFGLSSCNVTRVVTTESRYLQCGDTSVVINVKTVESYDATKKSSL